MCGRFVSARKRLELLEEFGVLRDRVSEDLAPDYNVAPTKQVYAVTSSKEGERELRTVRWGLIPVWAKDISGGAKMINARAETVAVKPAYRRAFARRRCLIPADGYYEWKNKKPFYIFTTSGASLAMAGIYELWRDGSVPDDHPRAWLWSASIITTEATDEVGEIHDRMPMIIAPDLWADWLDPATPSEGAGEISQLQAAMQPALAGGLSSYPVSTAVNFVRNNGPELIKPELPD